MRENFPKIPSSPLLLSPRSKLLINQGSEITFRPFESHLELQVGSASPETHRIPGEGFNI